MVTFPPCKINLGLNVIRRRPDGYHDINTCFFPVPWTDVLEVIPASELSFTVSGETISGSANDNLCLKAYQLIKNDFAVGPVSIHLHKVIPMGAGLGGGSSDGAWMLRMLNKIFKLGLSKGTLTSYAARLGSDCAFFLHDGPQMGGGRGDELSEVSVALKGKYLVIIKPDIHVSTADAYQGVVPGAPQNAIRDVVQGLPIQEWKSSLKNDFEDSVFKKYPQIREVKEKLYSMGARYASMTGSGAAVFGIFDEEVNGEFEGMMSWKGGIDSIR